MPSWSSTTAIIMHTTNRNKLCTSSSLCVHAAILHWPVCHLSSTIMAADCCPFKAYLCLVKILDAQLETDDGH